MAHQAQLAGPRRSALLLPKPPALTAPACYSRSACRPRHLGVRCKPSGAGLLEVAGEQQQEQVLLYTQQEALSTVIHEQAVLQGQGVHATPQQPPAASTAGTAQDPAVRARLWKAAIKVPMYSVGYIPVMVAGAAVYFHLGIAPLAQLAGFAVASIMIIAWLNLSNDAFDAHTGVDDFKPESVVNLTGNWGLVAGLAVAFFVAGTGLLAALLGTAGDMRPAALLAFSIVCGYVYQGPPFRLSYKGLGEPLCFVAFGPSATTAFYLAMSSQLAAGAAAAGAAATTAAPAAASAGVSAAGLGLRSVLSWVPSSVWWCSVLVGLTTTIILFTSHFHQIEGDKAAGKMSPLVRLGAARGLKVLQGSVSAAYLLAGMGVLCGALPLLVLPLLCCSLPAARELLRYAVEHHLVPARIAILKRFACMWHIAYGCSLVSGLVAARVLPSLLLA